MDFSRPGRLTLDRHRVQHPDGTVTYHWPDDQHPAVVFNGLVEAHDDLSFELILTEERADIYWE